MNLEKVQENSYARASEALLGSYPIANSMNPKELDDFLQARKYAVFATSRPDGRAHAAPVAFTIWRDAFWIGSIDGLRVGNLRKKAWASIVVIEGEPPTDHRAVVAEGPVKLHNASQLKTSLAELLEMIKKKHVREPTWATVIIELNPEKLFSYNGSRK